MLRAVELGVSIADLDLLDIGLVMDMVTEKINDTVEDDTPEIDATQDDFDKF